MEQLTVIVMVTVAMVTVTMVTVTMVVIVIDLLSELFLVNSKFSEVEDPSLSLSLPSSLVELVLVL